jgi:hypothetical protein
MPIISYFFGIIIKMYFDDHYPPHFDAKYQGTEGVFSVVDGKMLKGDLPRKAVLIVSDWTTDHKLELLENWNLAKTHRPLKKIQGADND